MVLFIYPTQDTTVSAEIRNNLEGAHLTGIIVVRVMVLGLIYFCRTERHFQVGRKRLRVGRRHFIRLCFANHKSNDPWNFSTERSWKVLIAKPGESYGGGHGYLTLLRAQNIETNLPAAQKAAWVAPNKLNCWMLADLELVFFLFFCLCGEKKTNLSIWRLPRCYWSWLRLF